jgi:hypothetical protein
MGCIHSLNTIQRDFEQTKQNFDMTIKNLEKANLTIKNLEEKFSKSNIELVEAKLKLNEIQSYSIFNLPSMTAITSMTSMPSMPIPLMFTEERQKDGTEEKQIDEKLEENLKQNPNKITDSYFPSMTMPSFFSSPSSQIEVTDKPAPSLFDDFLKATALNENDKHDNDKPQIDSLNSDDMIKLRDEVKLREAV